MHYIGKQAKTFNLLITLFSKVWFANALGMDLQQTIILQHLLI